METNSDGGVRNKRVLSLFSSDSDSGGWNTKVSDESQSDDDEGFDQHDEPRRKRCKKEPTFHPCQFPGCAGVFTTVANRKRHERLHSGEKPFECGFDGCGKTFARKYDLKVHIRTHTKEKPNVCSVRSCSKSFSRNSSLREHERNVHNFPGKTSKNTESPNTSPNIGEDSFGNHHKTNSPFKQWPSEFDSSPEQKLQRENYPESELKQRFQDQKTNAIRFSEQKLLNAKAEPNDLTAEFRTQANELINRFQAAQAKAAERKTPEFKFTIPTLQTKEVQTPPLPSSPVEPKPTLTLMQGADVQTSGNPPIHSHVSSLMEEEERSGHVWDDLLRSFFPQGGSGSNQTMSDETQK